MTESTILGVGELLWDLFPDETRPGGAPFNFAFYCRQLGHTSAIVSRVGGDTLGRDLLDEVRSLGVSEHLIQSDTTHPTGTVQVHLGSDGQPEYEITRDVAWDFIDWTPTLQQEAVSVRAICFGTLAQRHATSQATIQRLCKVARDALIVCDVNLRQRFYTREVIESSLRLSRWAKLNADELDTLRDLLELSPADSLQDLRTRYDLELVCVTRGEEGCRIESNEGTIDEPGERVRVHDTVGAGDAFTAGLVCGHLEGLPLQRAARLANRLASRVASLPGGTARVERATLNLD